MSTYLTTTDTGHPSAQVEEFARLALALAVSAGAHLLLAQLLPQWVRPYEGASSAATVTLTVSLQPMPRVRYKDPIFEQPAHKSVEPADRATRLEQAPQIEPSPAQPVPEPGEQPAVPSNLTPERADESLSDMPPREDRPALPLLDYYYSSREVDVPAKAVGDALLVYPREALQLRVPGEVKLRLFIDEFGALVRPEVVSADPPGIFEEAALQAVRGMRFSPARKHEQTVRSQRTVQITFDPDPPSLRQAQSTLTH